MIDNARALCQVDSHKGGSTFFRVAGFHVADFPLAGALRLSCFVSLLSAGLVYPPELFIRRPCISRVLREWSRQRVLLA